MIPGCAEEAGRLRVWGAKVVSDGCQHCDETVAPMRQRKHTEFVKGVLSVGNGGEKPVEILLVDALGEKSNDSEEVSCIGTEAEECWGIKREFDGRGQALVEVGLEHL